MAQAGRGARDGVDEQREAGVVGVTGLVGGAAGRLQVGDRPPCPGLRGGHRVLVAGALAPQVLDLALQIARGRPPAGRRPRPRRPPPAARGPPARAAGSRSFATSSDRSGVAVRRPGPRLVPLDGRPLQLGGQPVRPGHRRVALRPQPGDVGPLAGVAQQRTGGVLVAGEDRDGRGVHRLRDRRRPLLGTVLAPPGHDLVGESLGAAQGREHRPGTDLGPLGGGEPGDGAHRGGQLGGGHLPDGLGHEVRDAAADGLRRGLQQGGPDPRRDGRGGLVSGLARGRGSSRVLTSPSPIRPG